MRRCARGRRLPPRACLARRDHRACPRGDRDRRPVPSGVARSVSAARSSTPWYPSGSGRSSRPHVPVAERFHAAGRRVYLVGGPVRDGIAGRPGGVEPGPDVDIDLTTDATPDEIEALVVGRRGCRVDAGKAFRDHRASVRGASFRDHDAPGGGLRARLPQTRGRFRQRHRDRPLAPGLHGERDGAQPARPRADRSVRRHRRTSPPAACAPRSIPRCPSRTIHCACSGRPGSSPVTA